MAGSSDKIKGRTKEAAGALTDNDKLRRDGRIDQATGKAKEVVEKGIEKAMDLTKGDKRVIHWP